MWISNCHCDFILQYVYSRVWVSSIFVKSSHVCVLLSYRAVIQLQCDWPPLSCPLTFNTHTHTHCPSFGRVHLMSEPIALLLPCTDLCLCVYKCVHLHVEQFQHVTHGHIGRDHVCVCCQGSGLGGGVMLAQIWLSGWVAAPTEHWQSGGWVRSRAVLHWIYVAAGNLKCHRSRETREKNVSDLRVCAHIYVHIII